MITLLTGDNSFEIKQTLDQIVDEFDGNAEVFDGQDLSASNLPDILTGVSLFAEKRLVVVNGLSGNKSVWAALNDWLGKVSDDIHLVLVDDKPDKRSVTYKSLKNVADVREYAAWSLRDTKKAEDWVVVQSKKYGMNLSPKFASQIVARVGVDQWLLHQSVQKLAVAGEVTADLINDVIDSNPNENAFGLLEMSTKGDYARLNQVINNLRQTEDVFRLFSLVASQVFQLLAVAYAGKTDNVAKDFGLHPYAVSKTMELAKKLGKSKIKKMVDIIADADNDIKTTNIDPWLVLENALLKIANA